MIRDQSPLDWLAIKSRTQDHEELKILLQNLLISSQFNQELRKRREYIGFKRKFSAKNMDRPFFGEIWAVRSCEIGGIVGHDAGFSMLDFCRPIFIGISLCTHMSTHG